MKRKTKALNSRESNWKKTTKYSAINRVLINQKLCKNVHAEKNLPSDTTVEVITLLG
jgi:hypothetical protein